MKKNEVLGGKYFNADDVRERDLNLTISEVTSEEFKQEDGYKAKKMVIAFRGVEKKLACGKEKAALLFEMFGEDSDTDDWGGNRIRLYLGKTNFGGKRVDCVAIGEPKANVKAPAGAKGKQAAAVAEEGEPEDDDSTPF